VRRLVGCAMALLLFLPGVAGAAVESRPWSDPGELVVSPDGRQLYAAGDQTLTFARDPATGALAEVSDIEPIGTTIAMSRDGRSVYVGGRTALHVLARDAGTGLLTHLGSLFDGEDPRYGLGTVTGIEVSPDGRQVYVAAQHSGLFAFDRDPATGLLAFRQARVGPATEDARDLGMAPDGGALYVAARSGVGVFRRDAATGALAPGELVATPDGTGHAALAVTARRLLVGDADATAYRRSSDGGLSDPAPVVMSREACNGCHSGHAILDTGTSVYAVDDRADELSHVRLQDDGTQERAGTVSLPRGAGLALSPDGRFVHATVGADRDDSVKGGVATFSRDPASGALRPVGATPGRVSFERSGTPSGLAPFVTTINGGAAFTNSRLVTVSVQRPTLGFASLSLTEEGTPAQLPIRPRLDGAYPLLLAAGPPGRTTRRVVVTPTPSNAGSHPSFSDDIILDQLPPTIAAATTSLTAAGPVVRLRARDERSGLSGLWVTRDRRRPGKLRRYRSRVHVATRRGLYVRVRDGAGNPSRWRAVRPAR